MKHARTFIRLVCMRRATGAGRLKSFSWAAGLLWRAAL